MGRMQGVKEGIGALSRAVKRSSVSKMEPADQGALSSIRSAGQKAFKDQAPARAAKEAEIQEGLAKLPPRSKKAAEEFGLYHPIGGGLKLSRPVSGMYATTVPDPMFNPPEIGIITPEQLVKEEAALFPLVGDRAAAGRYLTHVGENELEIPVRLTGGPRYMDANYNLISPEESGAWESGSSRVTALGRQAARAGEGGRPVYGVYTAGSAINTDFNIMGANALLQQLPFSEISKKAEKEFDRAMKQGSKEFPPIPDWPGIMSPEARSMILDKSNGIVRTKLFGVMGKENFQSLGFPDVAATRKSIVEPELLDVPTNEAGFRLARMDTTGRTIENPLIPSDYPVAMAGQVAGRLDLPTDYKDIWQSHFDARRLLSQPESGDYRSFSLAHPIQYADDEWLNRLMESRYQLEQRIKEGKAEGGAVESPEGIPPIVSELEQGFKEGGAVDHELKAWHQSQKMAKGGEVKMRDGGEPDYQGFFETSDSFRPSSASDEILVGRGVRRKRPQIGEIFETPAYAAKSALGAMGSAAKGAAQATVGTPGDIEMLSRGAGAAFNAMPGESALDAFLRGMESETYLPTTENIKTKIDPYLERFGVPSTMGQFETLGEFVGIPISVGAVKRGAGAVKEAVQAIPQTLATPPVGAIDLGGKPEKLSVNQLIAKLEAGEDLTPEQRQKAEYSKAQKEKYAQANIARQAKEPPPKEEKVKVPATDLGFYSPIEKALANTTRAQGSGQDFINDIMKFNPSSGELEGTGIVDWLKTQNKVTKQDVLDYLSGHKIEIKETVRGTILTSGERQKLGDINRLLSKGEYVSPEEEKWFEATKARLQEFKEPKHEREGLMLPGGKNYREIVLSLPEQPVNQYDKYVRTLSTKYGEGFDRDLLEPAEQQRLTELWNKSQSREGSQDLTYRSSHFPEKNILAHMRIQDMTFGGKKTLVIEEIQSDWHQAGRTKGYAPKDLSKVELEAVINTSADKPYYEIRTKEGQFVANIVDVPVKEGNENLAITKGFKFLKDRGIPGAPPDAPYKKIGIT